MPLISRGLVAGYKPAHPSEILTGNPHKPVSMRIALEPHNKKHYECIVNVSLRQALNLRIINNSMDDTWALLNMGSGNQRLHIRSSAGQSSKRTRLVQRKAIKENLNPLQAGKLAVSYRSENCSGIANVNAMLLSASELNLPVSVVRILGVDHEAVMIGDERVSSKGLMISDSWTIFGRALKRKDYALGSGMEVRLRYNPFPDPAVREDLFQSKTVKVYDVNRQYKKHFPRESAAGSDKEFVEGLLKNKKYTYNHYHSSRNLGIAYHADSDSGAHLVVNQSLPEWQYIERYNGPSRDTGPVRLYDSTDRFTYNQHRRTRWLSEESGNTHPVSGLSNPHPLLSISNTGLPEEPSDNTDINLSVCANPPSILQGRSTERTVPRRTTHPRRESRASEQDAVITRISRDLPDRTRRSSMPTESAPPITTRRSAAENLSSRPATSGGATRASHRHSAISSRETRRPDSRRAMTTATGRSTRRHTRHHSEPEGTSHRRTRSLDEQGHTSRRHRHHRHHAPEQRRSILDSVMHKLRRHFTQD